MKLQPWRVPFDLRIRRILFPGTCQSSFLRKAQGHLTSDDLYLGNSMRISQDDTDLRRRGTLFCELADLVDNLIGRSLEPGWRISRVWNRAGGNAFAFAVKATHFCCLSTIAESGRAWEEFWASRCLWVWADRAELSWHGVILSHKTKNFPSHHRSIVTQALKLSSSQGLKLLSSQDVG